MTCHLKELKSDYYVHEKDELANFKIDQTILIKEKFLKCISESYRKCERQEYSLDDWYPYVNSYYPYTEDVDAFARVNHLLATKPSFASLSSVECQSDIQEEVPYCEKSAQQKYLESNPVSFIILGKPGVGEQELGKQLADYWECVYIDPEVLIEQEIYSGSRAGQCIEFNLRCGRAIGVDVILRLVEKRVKSETAKHRGFVICGLPLIPNDLYEEDPVSSESAVFTVKEIFEEVLDTTIEIGVPPSRPHVSISSKYKSEDEELEEEEVKEEGKENAEEEEAEEVPLPKELPGKPQEPEMPVDTGPDYDICEPPEIGTNYEDQLNFIFDLMKTPFLIVYIMCSTPDVIDKRDNYRFDIYSRQTVNLQTERYNKLLLNYFSREEGIENEEIPEEFFESTYIHVESSNLQHLVKLPRHFPANVATQLDSYHYTALRFIERRVLMHDPQYYLKVDGRSTVQRMFYILKSRLNVLPLQKVLSPAKLNVIDEAGIGETEPQLFNTEGLTFEECFREFCKRQVPSIIFKWKWSDWGTKCPVSMKEGVYKNGDPNFAVRFMNRMFFLADNDAFIKFYRNPRPYLLPPYPKPSCRIFIFGPKFSGKSVVATCLSYLLNGTIVSITDMLQHFLLQKEEEYKERIKQAALAEAMQILNERRLLEANELEAERVEKIKEWVISIKNLIEELVVLLDELDKEPTVTKFEISSFPMAMRKVSVKEIETETTVAMYRVKEQMDGYGIPFSTKIQDWQAFLKDKRKLLIYLPEELKSRVEPIPATVFDEFVIEYAENAVANADLGNLEINNRNMVDMFISNIKSVEENYLEQGDNKGGWILDGMLCNLNLIQELYPDHIADEIIVLQDEDDFEFLMNRFKTSKTENTFREYRQFFIDIGKEDAAWRSPSLLSTQSYKTRLVTDILSDILDDATMFPDENAADKETQMAMNAEAYYNELLRFKDDFEEVSQYFLEHDIHPLEVKITNKSMPELMKEVIKVLEDRYSISASTFTEQDRAEEVKDLGSLLIQKDVGEGADSSNTGENLLEIHRRYGDTYNFCPVTFNESWVLWKGKEDLAVKFENKIYLLSNEEDMNKFLRSPRNYLTGNPIKEFPPPRICVVGIPGIGKTSISKFLSENFGLCYVSFESTLKKYLNINSPQSFDEIRRTKPTEESAENLESVDEVNRNVQDEKPQDSSELSDEMKSPEELIHNYLNLDEPLSEEIFQTVLSKLWFEYPINASGFVLDDFPKRPSDVEFMTKYKLIPDIIIHLTNSEDQIRTQLLDNLLNAWQAEMDEKRMLLEQENKQVILEWEENRKKRFEELMEEKREQRYSQKKKQKEDSPAKSPRSPEDTDRSGFRTGSQVSFDSVAEQEDIDEVNRQLDIEYPELILDDSLEKIEDATERFEVFVADVMDVETKFLENIKALCDSELIQFTDVICNFEYPEITKRKAFIIIDKFKYRTKSHFERSYDVSIEVADRLLSCGYFFLSKFGKTCPVQYYDNKIPVQMYLPMEQKYNIFPVIHRNYIYYVGGEENQTKFKADPLKYITVEFNFPLIPFRVAITGPPKCGKTVLAQRIRNEWDFKYISRGQAARYVLSYLPFSDLAKNMECVLRKGWELTDEMVAKCVEAASVDSKAVTQGIVFDGFPNTIPEVKHLSYVGLVPSLVIDLQASREETFECLLNDVGKRGFPRYSERFIDHILTEWSKTALEFREWFDREYQVTTRIPIKTSNWAVLSQAREYIVAVFFEIKHYYVHISEDWPLRLANMQVTPLEFLERQSCYKSYCPCCLHYSNSLNNGGEPPDRTGLVQFRKYFYWLCPKHIEKFLKMPEAFLVPYNNHSLPPYLPVILHLKTVPENVFENGKCIVCFKTKRRIVKGNIRFAAGYINKVYLFDTKLCLSIFMKNPLDFSGDIDFNPPDNYPSLKYQELPPLGMLEQYVAKPLTRALSFISRRRPVIPGLSIRASAAIGIGLYLEVHNSKISDEYKPLFREADDLYHDRRMKLINFLDKMKSVINPFLHYEELMPKFEIPPSVRSELTTTESVTTAISKIVSEIVDDALVE